MKNIRTLLAEEIECRVAQSGDSNGRAWCSLLLYKDARVDQRLLDEVVGPMNWKRDHQLIGDRLYCTVSIWDSEKKEWISKQDVGTESNTEKEKGQASDSFKRACFNWGIGRELYSAPQIFISLNPNDYSTGTGKMKIKAKFYVNEIGYDNNRNITSLVIVDSYGTERFSLKSKAQNKPSAKTSPKKPTTSQPEDLKTPGKPKLVSGSNAWKKAVERLYNGEKIEDKLNEVYDITPGEWSAIYDGVEAKRMLIEMGAEEPSNK